MHVSLIAQITTNCHATVCVFLYIWKSLKTAPTMVLTRLFTGGDHLISHQISFMKFLRRQQKLLISYVHFAQQTKIFDTPAFKPINKKVLVTAWIIFLIDLLKNIYHTLKKRLHFVNNTSDSCYESERKKNLLSLVFLIVFNFLVVLSSLTTASNSNSTSVLWTNRQLRRFWIKQLL